MFNFQNESAMNKIERLIVYPLLGIILLIILSILCCICPRITREENPGFDYMGVIVGIFSFLVTLLIGWQIWATIKIDDKIEKAIQAERDKLKYEINKDIDDKIDQYNRMMKDILGLRLNSNNNDAAKTLKDISK